MQELRIGLLFVVVWVSAAWAEPWAMKGWEARAVVQITQPSDTPGADTAGVKVMLQGRARPDGADLRVRDSRGNPVPFQVCFLDAARYALIAFRAPSTAEKYFVYFGNPGAGPAPERVAVPNEPGAGPPTGDWIPRYGFTLTTWRRPAGPNPETVEAFSRLLRESPHAHGARWQRRLADGFNPFGASDLYLSVYRGWILIPEAGRYGFCTASDEGSFSFLDAKPLVHWPGGHTAERGARGEKSVTVELQAGLHYLEYYHEEVKLEQLAFLGWRSRRGGGSFEPIPDTVFSAPHTGEVRAYEDAEGRPLLTFEPRIVDSVWPAERVEGQYTRVECTLGPWPQGQTAPAVTWTFGDGQTATGSVAEHVYLRLGQYELGLHAPGGTSVSWPLEVYEVQQVTETLGEGNLARYADRVQTYDRDRLDAESLCESALLFREAGRAEQALAAGRECLRRAPPECPLLDDVRRVVAAAAISSGQGSVQEATAVLNAILAGSGPPETHFEALADLLHVAAVERGDPEDVRRRLAEVDRLARSAELADVARAAYRRAVIAGGDALLWQGLRSEALLQYRRAEVLDGTRLPFTVRAARVGAYPGLVAAALSAGDVPAASAWIDEWERTFPTEIIRGQTWFWRANVHRARGEPLLAGRLLEKAIPLLTGSMRETEARWELAESLWAQGQIAAAKATLEALVKTGIKDAFTRQAADRLATLQ